MLCKLLSAIIKSFTEVIMHHNITVIYLKLEMHKAQYHPNELDEHLPER